MSNSKKDFQSFDAFLVSLQEMKYSEVMSTSKTKVASEDHFEAMRAHLLDLYSSMDVPHSFRGKSGQIFDCVPIEQQPSLRKTGEAPVFGEVPHGVKVADNPVSNVSECPPGMIPMRRITLEELTGHETLGHFMSKSRRPKSGHPRLSEKPQAGNDPEAHKYAHAYQTVNNMGASNILTIGHPTCDNSEMSLSQHWYAGGNGDELQTCEVGWQVQLGVFGDYQPHLFTYWTADGYNKTGSYNLEGGHFVQLNHKFAFGEQMPKQDLNISVSKQGDKWYIFLDGVLLGYYPCKLYGNGVMAKMATSIDFGGETAGHDFKWPPMGTGSFPGAKAAKQYNTWYFPYDGTHAGGKSTAPNLTPNQTDPDWYKIKMEGGASFEFGGPGGGQ